MARVLLIDDDEALLEALRIAFEDAGHQVETATDGATGLEQIARKAPELVVCDVILPKLDGFSLCRRLRESGSMLPMVLLTSRDSEIDEALGLELGADDYVTKPFRTRVLLARVAALLRRDAVRCASPPEPAAVVSGQLALSPDRLEARYAGQLLAVTLTEFRLLEALATRPGIVLSRSRLLELARGDDSVVNDRIVDTYVNRLRRKLERIDPSFSEIETVSGAGYRWRDCR